jgi:phasin family protein
MMNIVEFNKTVFGSFQKLFEINHNLALSLAQQQLDIANIYVESSIKQTQVLSAEIKPLQELLYAQSKLVQEVNKKLLNNSRNTLDVLVDAKEQFTEWSDTVTKQAQAFITSPATLLPKKV